MISRLVAFCARRCWLIIALGLLVAFGGNWARQQLTGDVIPDLADPQIGIVADWIGHSAPAVASDVTKVMTDALAGVKGAKAIRGLTMARTAYVDVIFDSADGLDEARQNIVDRLNAVRPRLPAGVRLDIGQSASTTGWVFEYGLSDPLLVTSLLDLRRFQDDVLRPALSRVPGVAEVVSVGGEVQELRIDAKARELRARGLAFSDLYHSLQPLFAANQGVAQITPSELQNLSVKGTSEPVRLGDIALVRFAEDEPAGQADVNGVRAVGGIVIARRDANITSLVEQTKKVIARETLKLPHRAADPRREDSGVAADVHVSIAYDRAELAAQVRHTLLRALSEEVLVVVLVILIFLMHGRSALVPLITLPVVVLLTLGGMWLLGVPGTVMSFGGIGIALGLAVDADIVALEASHRQLEVLGPEGSEKKRRASILAAAQSFAPAILTALVITAISFLPVFAFSGETGRLLRPLALTKTLVIASAALVTLTLAPALRDRLMRGRVIPEFTNPITRGLVRVYRPFVHFALNRPTLTLVTAGLALVSCLPIVTRLGAEFLPHMDEGDLFYMPTTLAGAPTDDASQQLRWQDHAMSKFGEVTNVFGKIGRAETGTDPAPYSMIETTLRLHPRSAWPTFPRKRWYSDFAPEPLKRLLRPLWPERTRRTTPELIAALDQAVRLPGWAPAWTAPARARMDMMATGVRVPVGISIVSPDPKRLDSVGTAIRDLIERVPGTRSAVLESQGGENWVDFDSDPVKLARYNVDPAVLHSFIRVMTTGGQVGEIEYNKRMYRVRLAPEIPDILARGDPDVLRDMTFRSRPAESASGAPEGAKTASGLAAQPVPLALLGKPVYVRRPAALRLEKGELCNYVHVDLEEGVDVEGYVARAKDAVQAALSSGAIQLKSGERVDWTGQYELLIAGQQRLLWIIPLVAFSMLGLLYLQFRSFTEALLVLVSVPFALVGSFWTLYLLGYSMSAPVWVGLLSVVGLAMQTGVVMVVYIDAAFHARLREGKIRNRDDIVEAHAEGTIRRLRPKVMTITTMAAALLPLLWAEGAGSDIMRRVAAPMIGGLATSAFLTLEVLPVLYTLWRTHQLRKANRLGVPIASVVGKAPGWARGDRTEGAKARAIEPSHPSVDEPLLKGALQRWGRTS